MTLPKNTAVKDAEKDAGYLSPEQVEEKVEKQVEEKVAEERAQVEKKVEQERAAQAKRDEMWSKVAQCKTPKDYKDLIDSSYNSVDYLLELLGADSARTTILNSARLSPAAYLKLKIILATSEQDLKDFLVEAINNKYEKVKTENK